MNRVEIGETNRYFKPMKTNSIPVYFYPSDMCETCINQIEELITSCELSEAQDLLNEVQELGYTCSDCIALEEANL